MASFSSDVDRKVIPRWRSFADTVRLGETGSSVSARRRRANATDFLAEKLAAWRVHGTRSYAADAVGAAISLARETEVVDAAKFLLRDSFAGGGWRNELAMRVLDEQASVDVAPVAKMQETIIWSEIRALRAILGMEPRDPIRWVDLSRLYTILGLTDQATRCMNVGLQLAEESRFVIRAASRLWTHLGDPGKAHGIVARSGRVRHDPWLLAAEIATASDAGKSSMYAKMASRVIDDSRMRVAHISELASALATLELKSGSVRKARSLFVRSLESPTENSVAQAAWAHRENHGIRFDSNLLSRCPNTYEARYWDHYVRSEWKSVLRQCRLWQYDQPFSRTPGIQGSYIAAVVLQDYRVSQEFSSLGLLANPGDPTLLNNLAFARLNLGDTDAARDAISRIDESKATKEERTVIKATKGLLQFRVGRINEGRQLYGEAIEDARKSRNGRLLGYAQAFYALEEPKTIAKRRLMSEALASLREIDDPAVISFRGRLKLPRPPRR